MNIRKLAIATGIAAVVGLAGFGISQAIDTTPDIRYTPNRLEISQTTPEFIFSRYFTFDGQDCRLTLCNLLLGEDTAIDLSCNGTVDLVDVAPRPPHDPYGYTVRRVEDPAAFARADVVYRREMAKLSQQTDLSRHIQNWMVHSGELPPTYLRL